MNDKVINTNRINYLQKQYEYYLPCDSLTPSGKRIFGGIRESISGTLK